MRILSLILLLLLASQSWAESAVVVDGTRVNLRSGRADTYRIIKSLEPGSKVEVLDEAGGYTQVRTESGDKGWLPTRMLKIEEAQAQPASAAPNVAELQTEIAKLRSELAQTQKQPPAGTGAGLSWLAASVALITGVLVGMCGLRAYYLKRLKGLRI